MKLGRKVISLWLMGFQGFSESLQSLGFMSGNYKFPMTFSKARVFGTPNFPSLNISRVEMLANVALILN